MCGTNFFPLTPPLMWQIVSERPLTEISQPVPGGSNSSSQQHIGEEYIHIGSDLYCRFSGIWIYVWRGVMSKEPNGFPGGLNAYFIVRVSPFFPPVFIQVSMYILVCLSEWRCTCTLECMRVIIHSISGEGFLCSVPSQRRPIKAIRQRQGSRAALRTRRAGEQRI